MPQERVFGGWGLTPWTVWLSVLVLLAIAGPLCFGLPVPGFRSGADANFALSLTRGYMAALQAGVPFPRWLPQANAGLGSPAFLFYGRLPFFIAAILGLGLRLGPVTALLAGFAFFRALAFCTCRAWLRLHSGERGADCGALAFIALPFAMSLNPVTRVGFAETAATAFIPLLFLALEAALASRRSWLSVAGLAVTYALLACTHLPQLVLAAAVTMLYAISCRHRRMVWVNASGLGLGLLLSAASVAPALLLQGTISPAAWSDNPFIQLGNNFLFTLARSRQYGFYTLDTELYSTWLLCAVLLLACWRKRKQLPAAEGGRWWALTVSLAIVLLSMTGIARPLWLAVHPLQVLQFPWRLFPGALALAAALAAVWVGSRPRRQMFCMLAGACLILGQIAVAAAGALVFATGFRSVHQVPARYLCRLPVYVPDAQRDLPSIAQKRSFVPEYLPVGARLAGWHLAPDEDQLLPGAAAGFLPTALPGLAETRLPDGTIRITGSLSQPRSVVLPTFYFPDEAIAEAIAETIAEAPGVPVTLDRNTGLASINLPAGPVAISLSHARPLPAVRYGQSASALGAALLLLCLLFAVRGEGKRQPLPLEPMAALPPAATHRTELTAALR